ncbi:MAG: hypothetical protein IJE43_01855 [Alphaproteobacteria bacterium]|nr:hypothetical protein [Alphaproteobacteria bacterium]MBQ3512527.1 hypothetical protein [Lachnospiraceae bacterium]
MRKEFKYVSMKERVKLLYKATESFVRHKSAPIVDIMDGKIDPRKKFNALFDFEKETLRPDVYDECKKVLTVKIMEENSDYSVETREVQDCIKSSIAYFIRWVKARSESGNITWDELVNHLHNIPWEETEFGVRIQRFGKAYYELHFNYMQDLHNGCMKFYNAEYPEDTDNDGCVIDMASYVAIVSDDIETIHMGYADLIYEVGLRDVTISYTNGEKVFLRFSEEN